MSPAASDVYKRQRLGLYSGMCSELCGINHGYMPISLKTLSRENFIYMLNTGNMVVKNSNK
jgi:heme/copper-type cytochrome/quinol oxidase subunit 2